MKSGSVKEVEGTNAGQAIMDAGYRVYNSIYHSKSYKNIVHVDMKKDKFTWDKSKREWFLSKE